MGFRFYAPSTKSNPAPPAAPSRRKLSKQAIGSLREHEQRDHPTEYTARLAPPPLPSEGGPSYHDLFRPRSVSR